MVVDRNMQGLLSALVCVFKIQKVLVHLLVFLGKSARISLPSIV
jgi:hypothetical protein